jgi:Permease for cytosine/purines, uracil, thiamine, allantoin
MHSPSQAGVQHIPESDLEKRGELKDLAVDTKVFDSDIPAEVSTRSVNSSDQHDSTTAPVLLKGKLAKWNAKVEGLAGLEARGITRVLPEERHGGGVAGYLQMLALWFGINLVVPNMIAGLLGPLLFNLGWVDCVCIVIFANALSACGPAYISTFGPRSGNRTMVCLCARCLLVNPWHAGEPCMPFAN